MALPNTSTSTRRQNRGPCLFCFNAVKWVPVLFIMCIVLWSYYAFVVQLCLLTIETTTQQILYLFMYHILFILFIWAYFQTIFTHIGVVPAKFKLPPGELDRLAHADSEEMQNSILERFCQDLPNRNRTVAGTVRYCDKCRHIKPDRAHHCSVCGMCILKMDHHCPWVNNCVCFTNYKFFILFLGYALIYCIYISLTSVEYFISFWRGHHSSMDTLGALDGGTGRFHILFLFFVAVMFAVSLASLFFYHVYLVSVNRTTLEAFRAPIFVTGEDKHAFDLGKLKNFQEVFGDNPKLWFLPVFTTSGDGVVYPMRSHPPSGSYQTMENSQTSLGDGIHYERRHTSEDMQGLLGDTSVEEESSET